MGAVFLGGLKIECTELRGGAKFERTKLREDNIWMHKVKGGQNLSAQS